MPNRTVREIQQYADMINHLNGLNLIKVKRAPGPFRHSQANDTREGFMPRELLPERGVSFHLARELIELVRDIQSSGRPLHQIFGELGKRRISARGHRSAERLLGPEQRLPQG